MIQEPTVGVGAELHCAACGGMLLPHRSVVGGDDFQCGSCRRIFGVAKRAAPGLPPSSLPPSPGSVIQLEILRRQTTQRQIGVECGLAKGTITGIVHGRIPITPDLAGKLGPVFGIKPDELLRMEAEYRGALARLNGSDDPAQQTGRYPQMLGREPSSLHGKPLLLKGDLGFGQMPINGLRKPRRGGAP